MTPAWKDVCGLVPSSSHLLTLRLVGTAYLSFVWDMPARASELADIQPIHLQTKTRFRSSDSVQGNSDSWGSRLWSVRVARARMGNGPIPAQSGPRTRCGDRVRPLRDIGGTSHRIQARAREARDRGISVPYRRKAATREIEAIGGAVETLQKPILTINREGNIM
jgi:hypothetical protein